MTAFTLGEATMLALGRVARPALAQAASERSVARRSGGVHRTGAPVRRDSIEAGSFEALFFANPATGECDRMLRAARAALDAGRRLKRAVRTEGRVLDAGEAAIAALTAGAIRVFEELCTLARLNKGRVYPSYDRLARVTALGRATVARALACLEAAGFLVRQRRFVRIEGEGAGPRYAQTSNAYRPVLPRLVARLLPRWSARWRAPAPIPDDTAQHIAEHAEAMATMRGQLNCRELAETSVGGMLGRVLAKLGAAIDHRDTAIMERESHNDAEPLPRFIEQGETASASTADTHV